MNQKLIAIFLAAIMLMSLLPLFMISAPEQSKTDPAITYDAPGFDSIPGAHVNHEFNSIADGLDMTPKGVISARYLDVSRISGTPLEVGINTTQLNALYNAKLTKTFFANYINESSWFELHTISPEIVAFQYWLSPTSYNGYRMLIRETGSGTNMYNVIGTPLILGPQDMTEDVIDVLSGSSERSDEFEHILSYADMDSEFQIIANDTSFASQYYLDFKRLDSGEYSRTVVYLDATNSTLGNLARFETNSTERGVVYDLTTDGNITKVVVTGNFHIIANEPME
ncbi:MAG TPA: hypothetical protein C5S50_07295 [Methanosarcinaceae archaeon]|nr:hypothetical protein [Methanosarcinaceae archaeon]